jgi:alkaline phosphatase D
VRTREPRWYDLFHRRGTRRDFLRVGGGAAALVALGALPGCGGGRRVRFAVDPFELGVASGDPSADGVVLWTRLGRRALEDSGATPLPVDVGWEVAADDTFRRTLRAGTAQARPELGHSVHVEVEGLEPGREYFYRMLTGGVASPVGRTKTAPARGAAVDAFRFAIASCQNYEHGLFTALRHLSEEDIDLVVHLGDYIYERTFGESRVRRHEGEEALTLDDYRGRYTTYKLDADLQAAHLVAPWVVTWDDHEVANNYADGVPEDGQPRETFLLRRAAAYQAYYEFMPLRRSAMPDGPDMPLYRRLAIGRLLEMSVLDTRQYRSDQPCGDRAQPTCAAHVAPKQSILGADQRAWLFSGLAASEARWNVLAQQVMMARMRGVNAVGEETWSMDMWDGYPLERRALLDMLAELKVPNPVVLTGDIHSNWVTDLHRDFDDLSSEVVATELVGTSISSGGDGGDMTAGGARVLANNPHVRFYNGQRGYMRATVTPERWTNELRVVPTVTEPGGQVRTRATFVVENGRAGAREA